MVRQAEKENIQTPPVQAPEPIRIKKDNPLRRGADIFVSALMIILLSPLFIILDLLILLFGGKGGVIYRHERVGRGGKHFKMWKFRTMRSDIAPEDCMTPEQLSTYYTEFKVEDDPRITGIGKFLRKTSLDELPQVFNVLFGHMSFIGPRPITEEETELFGEDRAKLLSIRPGITGYWQAYARNGASYDTGERQKMELYYVENRSFWFDIKILFKTFGALVSGRNAY